MNPLEKLICIAQWMIPASDKFFISTRKTKSIIVAQKSKIAKFGCEML